MKSQRKTVWLVAAIGGGLVVLFSLSCFPLAWLTTLSAPWQNSTGTVVAGAGLILLGLATALTIAGITGWRGTSTRPFYPRGRWVIVAGVLMVILMLVALVIPGTWQFQPFFALFHVGLIALPTFLLLALATLVAGREAAPTLRQVAVALNGGALSTGVAFVLEMFGLVICLVLVTLGASLLPSGQAELAWLSAQLEGWMQAGPQGVSAEELVSVLASPLVLVLATLLLAIITPAVEELCKGLMIGLLGWGERPSLPRAFLWGATTGIGFALLEGLTNGALGLGEVAGWIGGIGSRVVASAMHALVSGLVGLGWGLFWQRKRWGLPLLYLGAVAFHSLWNLCVVGMLAGSGQVLQGAPAGGLLSVASGGLLVVLALSAPVALIGLPLLFRPGRSPRAELPADDGPVPASGTAEANAVLTTEDGPTAEPQPVA